MTPEQISIQLLEALKKEAAALQGPAQINVAEVCIGIADMLGEIVSKIGEVEGTHRGGELLDYCVSRVQQVYFERTGAM